MPGRSASPACGALIADEIGLETGVYGVYRLRSLYQPVFRISSGRLIPEGLEASVLPLVDFTPVKPEVLFSSVDDAAEEELQSLCNLMHIGNHLHTGQESLSLHLPFGPALLRGPKALDYLALAFARLAETAVSPRSLVFCVSGTGPDDKEISSRFIETIRSAGVRIAVDGFGAQPDVLETVDRVQPDIVNVDGSWFRRVANITSAVRLMRQMAENLQRSGIKVSIKGLEDPVHLLAAMSIGADLVQGDLLARPMEAGSVMDLRPLNAARVFRDPRKVVVSLSERWRCGWPASASRTKF
ncbi:MAG: EAL domain-containing protein [Nitratireductor rhodophyticola]|uniref:EAL domain-containing protein n=1 Tax=Nitratireductor rhodophyticola TaxID=2854036 RepID=UPI0032D8BE2E